MTQKSHELEIQFLDSFMINLDLCDIFSANPAFTRGMNEIYANNSGNGLFDDFLFIHIAKTAGVSVNSALGIHGRMHLTAQEFIKALGPEKYNTLFTFSFVRNPWDRAVSQFYHLWSATGGDLPPFADWVKIVYSSAVPQAHQRKQKIIEFNINNRLVRGLLKPYMPQLDWLCNANGELIVDYVGRFERLQDDFDQICERIGVPKMKLPHHNASKREESYRNLYDDESRELIGAFFKSEIERFEYEF